MIGELVLLLQGTSSLSTSLRTSVNSELTDLALGLHPLSNPAVSLHQLTPNGLAAAQAAGFLHPLIGYLNISSPASTVISTSQSPATPPPPPPPAPAPAPAPAPPATRALRASAHTCADSCAVLDILNRSTHLTKLAEALRTSQLDKIVKATSNITIFAPDNAAFESLPGEMYQELLANTTLLQSILLRHMTRGVIYSADIPTSHTTLITGAGETVNVVAGEFGDVNVTSHMATAMVTSPDIGANNGVIHVINAVL